MDLNNQIDILRVIDQNGLFRQIENMTLKELRESLMEKGFCDLIDILSISIMVFRFLKGKDTFIFRDTEETMLMREMIFAYKYSLSKDEIETLKLMAMGLTNREIVKALKFSISEDGVAKRVRRIFKKMDVHKRQEAAEKAIRAGII